MVALTVGTKGNKSLYSSKNKKNILLLVGYYTIIKEQREYKLIIELLF